MVFFVCRKRGHNRLIDKYSQNKTVLLKRLFKTQTLGQIICVHISRTCPPSTLLEFLESNVYRREFPPKCYFPTADDENVCAMESSRTRRERRCVFFTALRYAEVRQVVYILRNTPPVFGIMQIQIFYEECGQAHK